MVVDGAFDKSRVAVISGGGSGHEPAMAGYVGAGLLTAAVCGGVFASPSEDAVLAAIRATTGEAGAQATVPAPFRSRLRSAFAHDSFCPRPSGCLLVVMNYTGDRLNFGAAAERAKAEGLRVEMVVVAGAPCSQHTAAHACTLRALPRDGCADCWHLHSLRAADDCALKAKDAVGRRGVAGTVFVLKTAGATAAAGASLADVTAAAEDVAARVGTMGASLTGCTVFGQPQCDRSAHACCCWVCVCGRGVVGWPWWVLWGGGGRQGAHRDGRGELMACACHADAAVAGWGLTRWSWAWAFTASPAPTGQS